MIKFTTFLYYSIPYTDVDTGYWSAERLGKIVTALGLWKREEQKACASQLSTKQSLRKKKSVSCTGQYFALCLS